jgi:phasin family protein
MATQTEDKTVDAKADAAAEKAYAQASGGVSAKKADAPAKPAAPKIDAAITEVKAAPKKAKRAAKPAAAKRAVKKAAKAVAAPRKAVKTAAPAKAPVRAGSALSKLKDTFMTTNTNTTDFAQSIKETAAQAQTRAKAAYDRVQAYSGEMTELTKGNVEALVESGKILGNGIQEIARTEIEAAKSAFETATADLKAMAAVKSPTELFKLQGEIARRNFDAAVARASKNVEVSMKLASEVFAPLSNRMSLAAERLSKAA